MKLYYVTSKKYLLRFLIGLMVLNLILIEFNSGKVVNNLIADDLSSTQIAIQDSLIGNPADFENLTQSRAKSKVSLAVSSVNFSSTTLNRYFIQSITRPHHRIISLLSLLTPQYSTDT